MCDKCNQLLCLCRTTGREVCTPLCLCVRARRHRSLGYPENAALSFSVWEGRKAEICSQTGAVFREKQRSDQFCSQCSMWKVNLSDLLALHSGSWRNCSEDDGVAMNLHQLGKVSRQKYFSLVLALRPHGYIRISLAAQAARRARAAAALCLPLCEPWVTAREVRLVRKMTCGKINHF